MCRHRLEITDALAEAERRMNRLGGERTPFLFVIDYEMEKPRVIEIEALADCDIEVSIEGYEYSSIVRADGEDAAPDTFEFSTRPISYERYRRAFDHLHRHFVLGNSYLANLTFATKIETDLTLRTIYALASAKYKLRVAEEFVCYSPEAFVTIDGETIASYPMKGTIDADLPNAEAALLADEKETAEHVTIVDLIRNDIGMIASSVEVSRFRYIDVIESPTRRLLQVSSEIRGRLDPEWPGKVGSMIAALLPAGSICGAPKKKTVEIIAEAEDGPRGYYTGVFGVFDGSKLASGVMIRFVERHRDGTLSYRSGGGLTVYADAMSEYREMLDKIYIPRPAR
jgi:para-aminobenzoate synthetase component I